MLSIKCARAQIWSTGCGRSNFFNGFSPTFFILFLTSYHIWLTESVELKPFDSSTSTILNRVFIPIWSHSFPFPPLHHPLPFPLTFLASLPLPHLHSLPCALSLPPFPSNSKNPQITKPYSTTAFPSLLHCFRSIAYNFPSTMASKVGSKSKDKGPIHEDSPPKFDHSTYPS